MFKINRFLLTTRNGFINIRASSRPEAIAKENLSKDEQQITNGVHIVLIQAPIFKIFFMLYCMHRIGDL